MTNLHHMKLLVVLTFVQEPAVQRHYSQEQADKVAMFKRSIDALVENILDNHISTHTFMRGCADAWNIA